VWFDLELAYPELGDLQHGVSAFESVALMPTTLYGYGKMIRIVPKGVGLWFLLVSTRTLSTIGMLIFCKQLPG
jgi:hypothetical protein